MSIFPQDINLNDTDIIEADEESENFREYAIDFKKGELIVDELGKNLIVEGIDAIKVWCWKALQTERYKYKAYRNFGNECKALIGQGFTKELIDSEVDRMVKESLLQNKYITNILNIDTELTNDILKIRVQINTLYGEVEVDV